MVRARKAGAIGALLAYAGLIVALTPMAFLNGGDRFGATMWFLLVPIAMAMIGILLELPWGRWLALGGAVAVLPWSIVLTATPFMETGPPAVALAASVVLLVTLTGRTMTELYERRAESVVTSPKRRSLISWTIICNIGSVLVLYLFLGAFDFEIGSHVGVTFALLIGLLWGVSRLAAGKTIGILAVGLSCVLLVPAGSYFVATESRHAGEALLLGALFLPGVVTAWACLITFGGPIWRVLRD